MVRLISQTGIDLKTNQSTLQQFWQGLWRIHQYKDAVSNCNLMNFVRRQCQICSGPLNLKDIMRGTCLVLTWQCTIDSKHSGSCASQKRINNNYVRSKVVITVMCCFVW